MIEGWHGDEYLILFDQAESDDLTRRYDLHACIPAHRIVGLRGWDDFILQNAQGDLLTVPTVPLVHRHLAPLAFAIQRQQIQVDDRLRGKIKWYVKPIVFRRRPHIPRQPRVGHPGAAHRVGEMVQPPVQTNHRAVIPRRTCSRDPV